MRTTGTTWEPDGDHQPREDQRRDDQPRADASTDAGSRRKLVRAIVIWIGMVGAVAYFWTAWQQGRARPIWLMNGLSLPYVVEIATEGGGTQRLSLEPGKSTRVLVPEGRIAVSVVEGAHLDPVATSLTSPFVTRPFANRQLVINPDRTAVLNRRIERSSDPGTYLVGEAIYPFPDVERILDDAFSKKYRSGMRPATFIISTGDLPFWMKAFLVSHELGKEPARAMLERQLEQTPDDAMILVTLGRILEREELEAFLATQLDAVPLRINAHRAWQTSRARPGGDVVALEAEYHRRLAAAPSDPMLAYLASRVVADPREDEVLLARALVAEPPLPLAIVRASGVELSRGHFDEGFELAQRAASLDPENRELSLALFDAAMASGRLDVASTIASKLRESSELMDDSPVLRDIQVLAAAADRAGTDRAIAERMAALRDHRTIEELRQLKSYLQAMRDYRFGDESALGRLGKTSDSPRTRFQSAVIEGRLEDAEARLIELEKQPWPTWSTSDSAASHLVFAIASRLPREDGQAASDARAAMARRHVDAAVALLRDGSVDGRSVADMLQDSRAPTAAAIRDLPMEPDHKRVVLVVLGQELPEAREACFAMAAHMNYDLGFPHLLIVQAIAETGDQP